MKKNILLVDDENVFHFINSKVITSTGIDCEIQTASNGQEALAIINKYLMASTPAPDYIFIDLNMPKMDGFEFIRAFKGMEFHHKEKTTIVILTSSIDPMDIERARKLGVDHFITKPLSEEDIRSIML